MGACFSFVYTMIIPEDEREYKRIKTEPPEDVRSDHSCHSSPKTLGSPCSNISRESELSYISPDDNQI